jgi:CRISPR-associated protein Cmr6
MPDKPILRNHNPNPSNNSKPSPWLGDLQPQPCKETSFVEYLRWMRSPTNANTKDGTKVELLQKAVTSNYPERLKMLNKRTRNLAQGGVVLEMEAPWRIRVGGQKGPESMLLPTFDASGIPYIPSTTLRGIARTQAINEFMQQENLSWQQAEQRIAAFFGDLDAKQPQNRMGKVIFFDAYPTAATKPQTNSNGGLAVDIVNNIWKWEGDRLNYNPSPNIFLSLLKPTFVIGLRPMLNCPDQTFTQIKVWLIKGLESSGAGAQINSGYGGLYQKDAPQRSQLTQEFFRVEFTLEGQLIHGVQAIDNNAWQNKNNQWSVRGKAKEEVRPIAFKSTLRYWFRALALGVCPPEDVQRIEEEIFGGIQNKSWGLLKVDILNGNSDKNKQSGILVLSRSVNMMRLPQAKREALEAMLTNLIWLSFRLGGVGQGARRPLYQRQGNPPKRGAELNPTTLEGIWKFPDTPEILRDRFREFLGGFYRYLASFSGLAVINAQSKPILRQDSQPPNSNQWQETVDRHCRIVIVAGSSPPHAQKNYALNLLHQHFHDHERTDESRDKSKDASKAKNLCGGTTKDFIMVNTRSTERKAIPSPIWIVDFGDFEVVTIFGATASPRKEYLQDLIKSADRHFYIHE